MGVFIFVRLIDEAINMLVEIQEMIHAQGLSVQKQTELWHNPGASKLLECVNRSQNFKLALDSIQAPPSHQT